MDLPPQPQAPSSDPNSISRFDPPQQQAQTQAHHHTLQKQRRPLSYQPQPHQHDFDSTHVPAPAPQQQQSSSPGRFTEEWDASQRGSSIGGRRGPESGAGSGSAAMQLSNSIKSHAVEDDQQPLMRGNTLKKKASMHRAPSLGRSSSRRSAKAGSVKSLALQPASYPDKQHTAFHCPVPINCSPTDALVDRFQTWRKILKDLIAFFREIQSHYEHKSKSLIKLANFANSISTPAAFLGIDEALQLIRSYNKNAITESNKAKGIEEDVILALTGLRSDLQQKIKEIKHLAGDFKNNVDKEMDATAKVIRGLADALEKNEVNTTSATGKQDPYLLRLAVDCQVERQLEEENYLHQAHLNLEGSGRELESIIVGEIQKAYNAFAGILKREADNAYGVSGELRDGPVSMPKDQDWVHFVTHDKLIVNPTIPLRSPDQIHYPGQDHISTQEIRAGLLERKSKYLKSYTAGWYVLSTTHLHEFKSADKAQAPVMSLHLPEQKLGSHSSGEGSSNKFILKGRQTGSMHRGHTWVFRAESHDTMIAWYDDIKALTEKSPEERTEFVRTHSRRSVSRSSRQSASSDGLDEDDEVPFSATEEDIHPGPRPDLVSRRSQPGGRFPSDIQVNAERGLQVPQSPSSVSSNQEQPSDAQVIAAATALPGIATAAYTMENQGQEDKGHLGYGSSGQTPMRDVPSQAAIAHHQAQFDGVNPYTSEPLQHSPTKTRQDTPYMIPQSQQEPTSAYQEGINDNGVFRGAETTDLEGFQHTNIGATNDDSTRVDERAVNSVAIPIVEVEKDSKGLQAVPGQEAAKHVAQGEASLADNQKEPVRPTAENRTNSMATVSNLHVPGSYPRNSLSTP